MRLSLSLSVLFAAQAMAAYDPKSVVGISDPVLIAKIEGYMPPICSKLYGDASHWSEWSICSATCGEGEEVRYLNSEGVKNLQNNGCEISIDKRQCSGTLCPQDCQYEEWPAEWSECDKTTGVQSQSRNIITPAKNGGKECAELWGSTARERNCAVDCEGAYTEWTECHSKAGTRSRDFIKTVQALNGGKACPASTEIERCSPECHAIAWTPFTECNPVTGLHTRVRDIPLDINYAHMKSVLKENKCPVVDTQKCDIDCQVSDWEKSDSCDPATGTRKIKRSIVQPAVNCGKPCDSLEHDTLLTSTETCPVHCELGKWSDWHCDKNSGVATRTRDILVNPLNDGEPCGSLQETKSCLPDTCDTDDWVDGECLPDSCSITSTRNMLYPKRDLGLPCQLSQVKPCTLDAKVSDWSEWSTCDANGEKTRTRTLIHAACNGGKPAPAFEEKTTNGCSDIICNSVHNPWPIDPTTGQDEWGPCNQATGIQTRKRTIIRHPGDGQVCNTEESRECAVNCVMDAWKDWTTCDACTGLQSRERGVLQPELNGGNKCEDTKETQNCAVVCETTEWSVWSHPDETCTCTRTRDELSPALNGGECVLVDKDPTCPQNCEVSDWSVAGECHTSGPHAGYRQYTRTVTKQRCNSGADCPDTEKWEPCDIDCVVGDWAPWTTCDLHTQLEHRSRPILQETHNQGKQCEITTEVRPCGTCEELLHPYTYGSCNIETGLSRGTAEYKHAPKQGQSCLTSIDIPCDVSCVVSDWSAGSCDVRTGKQKFTRSIITKAHNNGEKCPHADELVRYEDCKVDCVPTEEWGPWSDCDKEGFSKRKHVVDIVAQNGGSNEACLVQEVKVCPVDCVIDPATGEVIQKSLNGGLSCKKVAAVAGLPGDYSDVSETSSINFMATLAANKQYAMAALATGGVGLMFVVGLVSTRRQRRNGYDTITRHVI